MYQFHLSLKLHGLHQAKEAQSSVVSLVFVPSSVPQLFQPFRSSLKATVIQAQNVSNPSDALSLEK